jgi:TRAP-type C4-dicarboxylate transport system substrate-binding protein
MKDAISWQRSISAKADSDALAELQKKGMTYSEMPATEREAMKKATSHVVDDVKKRLGAPFVDQVLAEVKKAGG